PAPHPSLHSFPTRRSSDLSRAPPGPPKVCDHPSMQFNPPRAAPPTTDERELLLRFLHRQREEVVAAAAGLTDAQARWTPDGRLLDRKSTRLNSSHVSISYA